MARKRRKVTKKFGTDIDHFLKPKHEKLSDKDAKALKEKYNIGISQLPGIFITDPAIKNLNVKVGEIIKITRQSPTGGKIEFYREVIYESALDVE